MLIEAIKLIAVGLSLSGAFLVASSRREHRLIGFSLWIAGNIIWLGNALNIEDYIQSGLWVSYTGLAIYGVHNNLPKKQ